MKDLGWKVDEDDMTKSSVIAIWMAAESSST